MRAVTNIWLAPGQSIQALSKEYYKILKHIGTGGNAIAFQVLCTSGVHKGLTFVLKIQYNLSSPKRIERFLKETDFLKNSNHPAILRHFDSGVFHSSLNDNDYPFLITSYFPQTLEYAMQGGNLTFADKVSFACDLASTLKYLRQQQIVHRDIKPGNIFVDNHNAIIGDFGLMKNLSDEKIEDIQDDIDMLSESLETDVIAGGYIAMPRYYRTPELVAYARNEREDIPIESDVFQLGLVLAKLFTGKNPLVPDEITKNIRIDRIGFIGGTNNHGGLVSKILWGMLEIDHTKRLQPDDIINYLFLIREQIHINGVE